jgi:hypothetical protein
MIGGGGAAGLTAEMDGGEGERGECGMGRGDPGKGFEAGPRGGRAEGAEVAFVVVATVLAIHPLLESRTDSRLEVAKPRRTNQVTGFERRVAQSSRRATVFRCSGRGEKNRPDHEDQK